MLKTVLGAFGVDVSQWQGQIDWRTLKSQGVEFAIIKVGHNHGRVDPGLARHRDAARAAGLQVGYYWYAYQALDPIAEAQNFVAWSGRREGEPMFIDAEEETLTPAWCARFMSEVDRQLAARGSKAVCHVYTYSSWLSARPAMDAVIGKRALWLASYGRNTGATPTGRVWTPRGMTAAGHQFTSALHLPGYAGGPLDVNIWYGGVSQLVRLGGGTPGVVQTVKDAAKTVVRKIIKPTVPAALEVGSTGPRVKNLQLGLNKFFPLYSHLTPDGVFGAKTKAVVVEFQKRSGLTPDGIVGPATLAALAKAGIRP